MISQISRASKAASPFLTTGKAFDECHRPDPTRSEPVRRAGARSHARLRVGAAGEGCGHAAGLPQRCPNLRGPGAEAVASAHYRPRPRPSRPSWRTTSRPAHGHRRWDAALRRLMLCEYVHGTDALADELIE